MAEGVAWAELALGALVGGGGVFAFLGTVLKQRHDRKLAELRHEQQLELKQLEKQLEQEREARRDAQETQRAATDAEERRWQERKEHGEQVLAANQELVETIVFEAERLITGYRRSRTDRDFWSPARGSDATSFNKLASQADLRLTDNDKAVREAILQLRAALQNHRPMRTESFDDLRHSYVTLAREARAWIQSGMPTEAEVGLGVGMAP